MFYFSLCSLNSFVRSFLFLPSTVVPPVFLSRSSQHSLFPRRRNLVEIRSRRSRRRRHAAPRQRWLTSFPLVREKATREFRPSSSTSTSSSTAASGVRKNFAQTEREAISLPCSKSTFNGLPREEEIRRSLPDLSTRTNFFSVCVTGAIRRDRESILSEDRVALSRRYSLGASAGKLRSSFFDPTFDGDDDIWIHYLYRWRCCSRLLRNLRCLGIVIKAPSRSHSFLERRCTN